MDVCSVTCLAIRLTIYVRECSNPRCKQFRGADPTHDAAGLACGLDLDNQHFLSSWTRQLLLSWACNLSQAKSKSFQLAIVAPRITLIGYDIATVQSLSQAELTWFWKCCWNYWERGLLFWPRVSSCVADVSLGLPGTNTGPKPAWEGRQAGRQGRRSRQEIFGPMDVVGAYKPSHA